MNIPTPRLEHDKARTRRYGTPELFGQVSNRVNLLMEQNKRGNDIASHLILTGGQYTIERVGVISSDQSVELQYPQGQHGQVSLREGLVDVKGINSGIIAIERGTVTTEANSGKMILSGPGTLASGAVRASWDAGLFPMVHAAFNRFLLHLMMAKAFWDTDGMGLPTLGEDTVEGNIRGNTVGMYRSYGGSRLSNLYDSRYLFPQHRLTVEADGYTLRANLQRRILLDTDGREVTLDEEPVRVGPFEAALGEWWSPQIYHRWSGQLVRIGFMPDASRGRLLVMEYRRP